MDQQSRVKNKPATPLPFKEFAPEIGGEVRQDYRYINGGCGYCTESAVAHGDLGFSVAGSILPQDAAYIVHSANAYPKLVEALKDSIATTPPESAFLAARVAMLRELGEVA